MPSLTKVHSFDSKLRRAKAILRQIHLARKMFRTCIRTWEGGIKSHSLISPTSGVSSAVNLHDDVEDRMTQYIKYTTDINTLLDDMEFMLPNVIKPGEPAEFLSLAIGETAGTILATMAITEAADDSSQKGPFYGLIVGDVVQVTNSEDSDNDGYYTIASIQDTNNVEATGITVGDMTGTDNTDDERMTITHIQDYVA